MASQLETRPRSLAFISSNDVWGGSEELWSGAALCLARQGHMISVYKPKVDRQQPKIRELAALGCPIADLHGPYWLPRKLITLISLVWLTSRRMTQAFLWCWLKIRRPDIAVISQGLNYDGWLVARVCRRLAIPYVIISQKADSIYWPEDTIRDDFQATYRDAHAALFVSKHNLEITEKQLGFKLHNARVVRNPVLVDRNRHYEWPDESNGLRLACLARLDAREKGQDVLMSVLAQQKWRDRPISVHFYGSGHNEAGLKGMAKLLKLDNVSFPGFTSSPDKVWQDHHALILASNCEGLPLTLVEAMLCARPSIVTDAGGNSEIVIDGQTGFLAAATTQTHLDEALERAWAHRSQWREIGRAAARHIRTLVPPDPAATLARELLDLIDTPAPAPKAKAKAKAMTAPIPRTP